MRADLHVHTDYSDSSLSPEEAVFPARAANLGAIAITDHDTIDGVKPTQAAAAGKQVEVVSGIEVSTYVTGSEIHIVGLFVDASGWCPSGPNARRECTRWAISSSA